MASRRRPSLRALAELVVVASLCAACEPTFKPEGGSITIDGAAFRPTACHVLAGTTGGIALSDAAGVRLELTLPPTRLDAFQEVHATSRVRYQVPGKPAVDLGACGELVLRGEGYHAQSKRAASGWMTLSCSGTATVKGDLTFAGCF